MRRTALIIDDEPIWGQSLSRILDEADFEVIGNERTMASALPAIEDRQPDLVVTSSRISHPRSLRTKPWWSSASGKSASNAATFTASTGSLGATTMRPTSPTSGISTVARHAAPRSEEREPVTAAPPKSDEPANFGAHLTRREQEILTHVSEGMANAEIARLLWVSEQTVKFHLSNIYRKLAVSNRTEASRWAHMNGLVASAPEVALTGS